MQTLAMLKDPGFPLMESDQQEFVALYDGEVRYTDTLVEQVMRALQQNEIAGDTLVIVTSDHGEELFEHGGFDHGDSLYDEVMRVPLIFHWPGKLPAGQEVRDPVALIDILPTLVELVGGSAEAPVQGRSLVPYLTGQPPLPDAAEREIYGDGLVTGRGSLWCIWSGRHKYILTRGETDREELYDLHTDPTEQNDLAAAKPEVASRLKARIEEWRAANELLHEQLGSAETDLDPELLERLRSLGYID
jgi:arylsulfatase A-like enzyme